MGKRSGKKTDPYAGFAGRYDRFRGAFGKHRADHRAFFQRIFADNGVRSVLDCACGTGHDLHLFASLGCAVTGSDISPAMLARAKVNLRAAGLSIPLRRADYRALHRHFKREFDAVVCLSSSMLHMENKKEVIRALLSMRLVLRERGMVIITQGTTDRQWGEKPRFILESSDKDLTRLFVIDYLQNGARYNVLDIIRERSIPELLVWSVEYKQMLLKGDYARLMSLAGYSNVQFYGSYGFEPYSKETSDVLICVAQK